MAIISVENISKKYTDIQALDNVSFQVNEGELYGMIGADGAGKTSLFRILTTLMLADKGKAKVNGWDVVKDYKKIRNSIGYMPGRFSLYQDLTVEENLHFFATLFNISVKKNYDLIQDIYVHIEPFKTRPAGKLSGGMKQKLALCCALIHRPSVLFLDEPTTGVDVVSRKEFWEMLCKLKKQGITILVSTPYMDEATLCDRITLIQSGKILSIDTPQGIIKHYPDSMYGLKSSNMNMLIYDMQKAENIKSCFAFGEYLHLSFQNDNEAARDELRNYLTEQGHQNIELKQIMPNIEDCFIKLMEK